MERPAVNREQFSVYEESPGELEYYMGKLKAFESYADHLESQLEKLRQENKEFREKITGCAVENAKTLEIITCIEIEKQEVIKERDYFKKQYQRVCLDPSEWDFLSKQDGE